MTFFSPGVAEVSYSTGTGVYLLRGALPDHYTFDARVPDGSEVMYHATNRVKSEYGTAVFTSPGILNRVTITDSSDDGAAIDWQDNGQILVYLIGDNNSYFQLPAGECGQVLGLLEGNIAAWIWRPYPIAAWISGGPSADQSIRFAVTEYLRFDQNFDGSYAYCGTNPGADFEIAINRIESDLTTTQLGTVTFDSSGVATWETTSGAIQFMSPGDRFEYLFPSDSDDIEDISITARGIIVCPDAQELITAFEVWSIFAVSETGDDMMAASVSTSDGSNNGSLWVSHNTGVSWTQTPAGTGNWVSVDMSADGQVMLGAISVQVDDVDNFVGDLVRSTDGGDTWSVVNPTGGRRNWSVASVSQDGTRMIAMAVDDPASPTGTLVWTSDDGGDTWTSETDLTGTFVSDIATDASGENAIAAASTSGAADKVLVSGDYGATWSEPAGFPEGPPTHNVAMSDDGVNYAAIANNSGMQVVTSTDSGSTWAAASSPPSSGTRLCAARDGSDIGFVMSWPGGSIQRTEDWFETYNGSNLSDSSSGSAGGHKAIACSYDGQVVVFGNGNTGSIYVSTDAGDSWAVVGV